MAKLEYDIAPSELCTSRFFVIVQQYMQKFQVHDKVREKLAWHPRTIGTSEHVMPISRIQICKVG